MADNVGYTPGTGASIAADEIGGVLFQRVKMTHGPDGSASDVSAAAPMPVASPALGAPADAAAPTGNGSMVALTKAVRDLLASMQSADFAPGYSFADQGGTRPATDPSGAQIVRGQVLTDEGTFRANFANSALAVSLGTVTLTNGSAAITWSVSATIDLHAGDYIKLDADPESAWAQIESVDSRTGGTLVAPYAGTGGTGAGSRSIVRPATGAGGAISVASGQLTLASGTTNNAITGVDRYVDYGPLVSRATCSISQRIANQETHIGLEESVATPRWFARFNADGTNNTIIRCETGRNPTGAPSAAETETTTITLPNGATTASLNEYRIELLTEVVRFYVNRSFVAEHNRIIPAQHDQMRAQVEIRNATGVASSTSVVVQSLTGKNHNKLEVGVMSDTEQIVAATAPPRSFSYNVAGVISVNTDLIVIDCSQLRSLSIHCISMGTSGGVTVAWSSEPSFPGTPTTATLYDQAGSPSTTFSSSNIIRVTQVVARFCRLRLTQATTGGTTNISVTGFQQALTPPIATQTVALTSTRISPNSSDGHATTHHLISAASTNATSVKTIAGAIGLITVTNSNATARFFKLHNKASAPIVGTDTPVMTVLIPPNSTLIIGGNSPIRLSTGIAYAITTGIAVNDTGAVAANEHAVSIFYT